MEDVTNTSANDNTQGTEVVEQQKEVQQETQSADTLLGGKAETQPQEEAEPIAYDLKKLFPLWMTLSSARKRAISS